jgi:hypothetical protein
MVKNAAAAGDHPRAKNPMASKTLLTDIITRTIAVKENIVIKKIVTLFLASSRRCILSSKTNHFWNQMAPSSCPALPVIGFGPA